MRWKDRSHRIKKDISNFLKRLKAEEFLSVSLFWVLTLAGSIVLLWVALGNKYPLVFNDSASYLQTPAEQRASGYNLFIQIVTFYYSSLWTVVVVQSLFTSFLIMRIPCVLLKSRQYKEYIAFGLLLLLALVTDISKYVSWIMPDIFISWVFLGGLLWFISTNKTDRGIAAVAIMFGIAVHVSHLLIATLSILTLIAVGLPYRKKYPLFWKNTKKIMALFFITLLLICAYNQIIGWGFRLLPPEKGNFSLVKFTNYGLISKTLDAYCPEKKWFLCQIKDDLKFVEERNSDWFLWRDVSPYNRINYFYEHQLEVQEVLLYTIKSHWPQILLRSFGDTLKLLTKVRSYDGLDQIHIMIGPRPSKDLEKYHYQQNSRQLRLLPIWVRILPVGDQTLALVIYGYALFLIVVFYKSREWRLLLYVSAMLAFIFYNALVIAFLTNIFDRYNCRLQWPLLYVLGVTSALFISKNNGLSLAGRRR
jgi:hypothetical protein